MLRKGLNKVRVFQSTLPVGGATSKRERMIVDEVFQSTLPVGGATRFYQWGLSSCKFQSTLPVGGATTNPEIIINANNISIHAPRGGSDICFYLLT